MLRSYLAALLLAGVSIGTAVGASPIGTTSALAQIVPDRTLGNEASRVRRGRVNGQPARIIQGGSTSGSSLFHSFDQFNVADLQQVYFADPSGVTDIFTRVTGDNPSAIYGTLGVLGGANLFLLNPNGVYFGPNARLDIGGTFATSTAQAFTFADGSVFSAAFPGPAPLLTVDVPLGLQYGAPQGPIASTGQLAAGQDLILHGNTIALGGTVTSGGDLTARATESITIRDSVDQPFQAVAGQDLELVADTLDIFALNHPSSGIAAGGDLTLTGNTIAGDAHYSAGGDFRVQQPDGELAAWYSPYDPIIRANGDVSFESYEGVSLHIIAGGSVTIPGTITITGRETEAILVEAVTLSNDSVINIDGEGRPTLDIRAGVNDPGSVGTSGDTTGFVPAPPGTEAAPTSANITIGNVFVPLGEVLITNQYLPNLDLAGGNIEVGSINTTDDSDPNATFGGTIAVDARGDLLVTDTLQANSNILLLAGGTLNTEGAIIGQNVLLSGDVVSVQADIQTERDLDVLGVSGVEFGTATSDPVTITLGDDLLIEPNEDIAGAAPSVAIESSVVITANQTGEISGDSIVINGQISTVDALTLTADSTLTLGDGLSPTTLSTQDTLQLTAGEIAIDIPATSGELTAGRDVLLQSPTINFGDVLFTVGGYVIVEDDLGNLQDFLNPHLTVVQSEGDVTLVGDYTGGSLHILAGGSVTLDNVTIEPATTPADPVEFTTSTGQTVLVRASSEPTLDIRSGLDGSSIPLTPLPDQPDFLGTTQVILGVNGDPTAITSTGITLTTPQDVAFYAPDSGGTLTLISNGGTITLAGATIALQDAIVDTTDTLGEGSAGGINLLADQEQGIITLTNSALLANVEVQGNAGDIQLLAGESITVDETLVASRVLEDADAVGEARSQIQVTTGTLTLLDNSNLSTSTFGNGDAGVINIIATDTVNIIGTDALVVSQANEDSTGSSGDVTITTGSLTISGGQGVSTSSVGTSDEAGGAITITATDSVTIDGGLILSTVGRDVGGSGNGITINTGTLTINDGLLSSSTASSFTDGSTGPIVITATESVVISQGSITNRVNPGAAGQGNDITINTPILRIEDGGSITASTLGSSDAGTITINAPDSVTVTGDRSLILSQAREGSIGNGGTIMIDTQTLLVEDGGGIGVLSEGQGNAGSLSVVADTVTLSDEGVISVAATDGGNAGELAINARVLQLLDGSTLNAETTGGGGNIVLNLGELLVLSGGSTITANAEGTSDGGNIDIILADGFVVATPNQDNDIIANAEAGNGGNITIVANGIYGLEERPAIPGNGTNDIDASSQFGLSGTINLSNPTVEAIRATTELPAAPVDPRSQVDRTCAADQTQQTSTFVVLGRGGLPANPGEVVQQPTSPLDDFGTPAPATGSFPQAESPAPATAEPTPPALVEASGWYRTTDGSVVLAGSTLPPNPAPLDESCP